MRNSDNKPMVLEWLQRHPDKLVTVNQVANALGIHNGTASGCMSRLEREYANMTREGLGVYKWHANANNVTGPVPGAPYDGPPPGYMVEVVGNTRAGVIFGEGEDGKLWRLSQ